VCDEASLLDVIRFEEDEAVADHVSGHLDFALAARGGPFGLGGTAEDIQIGEP
jgi:hypothetical protein